MPQFFIHRPVFAWVIALFIVLLGVLAIPQLPLSRYPTVAPPTVSLYATYPGATPKTLNDSVVSLIERELSSVRHLLYFESSVDTSGSAEIKATFKPGTNPELAQVDVQNRIKAVEPRLPQAVRQNGLQVESATSSFLLLVGLISPGGEFDELALNDYMARNIVEELRRIEGVGRVQLFGTEQAMRVWVDPAKLISYGLSMGDLTQAIQQQNMQIAPGRVGDAPTAPGQRVTTPLTVQGQLTSPAQFAAIVLRAHADGSRLVLGDVARVELGAQSYAFSNREDGKPATSAAVQLSPGANAVRTAAAVQKRMAELASILPQGMQHTISFNTAPFVKISIEKVVQTLVEAMVLVFLVMYLFLQNLRYTLIPAIVAPVALLGTFAVMLVAGFSINVLTMFGMVLAIGIIVDDAIVVVENVERLMAEEGLSPRDATLKAMKEITGAIIGITLVLTAVFIPMAFASGSVGVIYQQFTLSMAVSILFSAFLALSLTPALCATLLKPVAAGHHEKKGFFGWFNRGFERLTNRYEAHVTGLVRRTGRMMLLFAAIVAILVFALRQLPSAFLPEEDQGYFMTSIQLPADATAERTLDVVKRYEEHVAQRPGIASRISVLASASRARARTRPWPSPRSRTGTSATAPRPARKSRSRKRPWNTRPRAPSWCCSPRPSTSWALPRASPCTCRTARARAMPRSSRPPTSCWRWPAAAACWARPTRTACLRAPACGWRSTARRPRPWAWALPPSARRCPRPWARCTSTTSPTRDACSRSSCRPTRPRACRSMMCSG